jgi:hypothetical protein
MSKSRLLAFLIKELRENSQAKSACKIFALWDSCDGNFLADQGIVHRE